MAIRPNKSVIAPTGRETVWLRAVRVDGGRDQDRRRFVGAYGNTPQQKRYRVHGPGDRLVYELYGLTEDEIKIVEGS